jgi:acetolactate synthase I/II/III large subunit
LKNINVNCCFAVFDGASSYLEILVLSQLNSALIKPIITKNTAQAVAMCDGYQDHSNALGVCILATNVESIDIKNNLVSSLKYQIPRLFITISDIPGKINYFDDISKYNESISNADNAEQIFISAIRAAYQYPKGPVHISIPLDMLKEETIPGNPIFDLSLLIKPINSVQDKELKQFSDLLMSGLNNVLLIGEECADDIGAILELATYLNINIVSTPNGTGLINPIHPLYHGVIAFSGQSDANTIVQHESVSYIISVGVSLEEIYHYSNIFPEKKVITVNKDRYEFKNEDIFVKSIYGNFGFIFDYLLNQLDDCFSKNENEFSSESLFSLKGSKFHRNKYELDNNTLTIDGFSHLTPQFAMYFLSKSLPISTHYVIGSGAPFIWAANYLNIYKRPKLSDSNNSPTSLKNCSINFCNNKDLTDFSYSYAIGCALASSDDLVVCLFENSDDFFYTDIIDLADRYHLKIVFIIINQEQKVSTLKSDGSNNMKGRVFSLSTVNDIKNINFNDNTSVVYPQILEFIF